MIRALSQYARDEVITRLMRVAWSTEVFVAATVGITLGIEGPAWNFAHIKPTEVSTALLTYAAIAFGFCISGMALVLTLPNQTFITWLIQEPIPRKSTNAYSDLLFVFSWTAVCHWLLVVLAFLLLSLGNGRDNLIKWSDTRVWRTFIGILFGITIYSSIQFLLTVITLSQVGRLYIKRIERATEQQSKD
jgi:hypothetical protein